MQTVLRVRDLVSSLAFYRDLLHFDAAALGGGVVRIVGPAGVPFLLAERGADLSQWVAVPVSGPGAWVYLLRPDLAELAAMVGGEPVEPYPGFRHLQIVDPDGYVVTFWESLPVSDGEILAIYQVVPERLKTALAGLDDGGLDLSWAPGKWTIRQIVHHIVDSDMDTFQVIRMALALPGREVRASLWSPDQWMEGLRSAERPVGPAVALLAAAHAWVQEAALALPDGLDRWVSWPSGYRADVRQLMRQVGGHALHHVIQVEETRRRY